MRYRSDLSEGENGGPKMEYTRDKVMEKIIESYLDADYKTIAEQYEELCRNDLSKLDNESLLALADGRSITAEEDSIMEE